MAGHGGPDVAGVRQHQQVTDTAQAAMLGSGVQNVYFGGERRRPEAVVSIAPPFGLRPETLPVRGREELLAELEDPGLGVRVLCGLGGCGKTRVALEVAARAAGRGWLVWWVPAGEADVLAAGMRALGRRLGLTDAELEHGDTADLVWQRLAALDTGWLLVLDNADDPRMLAEAGSHVEEGRGWLRPPGDRGAGLVVVTSRDGAETSWGRWCSLLRVGPLPATEAAVMLADYAGGDQRVGSAEDRVVLAGRLGGLPLAIKIAGSYLAAAARVPAVFTEQGSVRTCREYLAALEGGDLAAVFPAGGPVTAEAARGLVGRTWELTLDLLDARGMPEARAVLRLLACFADTPVPYELLLHPGSLAVTGPLAGVSGARVWQALTALDDHGLIDLAASPGPGGTAVARLHPLVRDTSRPAGGSTDRPAFLGLAARLLRRATESKETGRPEDPAGWPAWQLLAPHATALLAAVTADLGCPEETAEAAAYAALMTARYQAQQGMHTHAERQYRDLLAVRLRVLGPDHLSALVARHQIALEMSAQGRHAAAEAEFRDVLAAELRVLGPDHPSTLVTRHEIAVEMSAQGSRAAAEAEFREVLAAELRVLGPDHPSTLATRHQIAREMSAQGRHAAAEAEFRDVLAAELRVLGPDYPSTRVTAEWVDYLERRRRP
jgi:hypothetical protein